MQQDRRARGELGCRSIPVTLRRDAKLLFFSLCIVISKTSKNILELCYMRNTFDVNTWLKLGMQMANNSLRTHMMSD